uniref:Peptidase S1 domain-containing protein n=1 Tax=Electrophorus electricus TaxID=8005 RepID=A0AAY5ENN7_ELEEL
MAMLKFLQLLLLTAGVESAVVKHRLIGGKPCGNNERLHQVWVFQVTHSEKSFCGGTLIDKKWVLTAAHCYNKSVIRYVEERDIHIFDVTERTGDIMLLKLPGPVSGITPAKLPDSSCQTPVNGEQLQIAGHGSTVNQTGKNTSEQTAHRSKGYYLNVHKPLSLYFCWLKKRFGRRSVIYGVHKGSHLTFSKIAYSTSVCAPPIRKWINYIMTNH